MTPSLATYIALPGTAAQAMEHWHDVFGGELSILRYGDMDPKGMPFEQAPWATTTARSSTVSG
ncbi:hypothetical protein [Kocuria varians]|uniref:PhnB-like domain-containing protein n=1 Tax=Kocuria varians TaxID=1272 RepID=A0A7D7Q4P2_KOCVA|nr:hypothetical protein [Kocuria varians]QMS57658.1 hypothetical protein CIB50_0002406 [Kocuria varians]